MTFLMRIAAPKKKEQVEKHEATHLARHRHVQNDWKHSTEVRPQHDLQACQLQLGPTPCTRSTSQAGL